MQKRIKKSEIIYWLSGCYRSIRNKYITFWIETFLPFNLSFKSAARHRFIEFTASMSLAYSLELLFSFYRMKLAKTWHKCQILIQNEQIIQRCLAAGTYCVGIMESVPSRHHQTEINHFGNYLIPFGFVQGRSHVASCECGHTTTEQTN